MFPPMQQFGTQESPSYTEFMQKLTKKVDEMFGVLKGVGPVVPTVTTDDEKAAGQAATELQIDTERKKATPVVDEQKMKDLHAKWVEIKDMAEVAFKDKNFPESDKDRIFQNLWDIRSQFHERGITID